MGDHKNAALIFGTQKEIYDPSEIPFLPDITGTTPIHHCLKNNNARVTDRLINYLADTDFDHHARLIMRKIPKLIEQVPMAM